MTLVPPQIRSHPPNWHTGCLIVPRANERPNVVDVISSGWGRARSPRLVLPLFPWSSWWTARKQGCIRGLSKHNTERSTVNRKKIAGASGTRERCVQYSTLLGREVPGVVRRMRGHHAMAVHGVMHAGNSAAGNSCDWWKPHILLRITPDAG